MAATKIPTDITLYTSHTPNGIKASILLEALGLEYKVHPIKLSADEQKEPWFLEINPNGRIPALSDIFTDGEKIHIWESGAILEYLVDRYDPDHKVSYPKGSREHWYTVSWLMWQMGGLGPMQGQANHFSRYAPEKIEYGINRYRNETRRLYRVLDTHLEKSTSGYLVGDRLTVADIASWSWVKSHEWAGVDIEVFPHVEKWVNKLAELPAFVEGQQVGAPDTERTKNLSKEELMRLKEEEGRAWVQRGMQDDAKK